MAAIRVYLDEDVHTFLADALRLRGWDALTTQEAGRRGAIDLDQLRFATARGYALVTYNVRDFPRLHYDVLARAETPAGIVVGTQGDPRGNLRALFNLLNALSADALIGSLIYLNNWS